MIPLCAYVNAVDYMRPFCNSVIFSYDLTIFLYSDRMENGIRGHRQVQSMKELSLPYPLPSTFLFLNNVNYKTANTL